MRRSTNLLRPRRLRDLGPAGAAQVQSSTSVVFLFADENDLNNQWVTE
jgi:hypothetical protein